jgi:hypothetical protein
MSGTSPGRAAIAVPLGLALGATLGLVARGWMRVASADPEFSWAGTVFIVAAFTVWGLAQAIVLAVRASTSRRWLVTVTRVFGFVGTIPLFVGAGAIMAPTVIAGGLARYRTDWRTWSRALAGVLAAIPVVVVAVQLHDDWAWTWRWWLATAGLALVYGTIIQANRGTMAPQLDGWHVPRYVRILGAVGLVIAIALPPIGIGVT